MFVYKQIPAEPHATRHGRRDIRLMNSHAAGMGETAMSDALALTVNGQSLRLDVAPDTPCSMSCATTCN